MTIYSTQILQFIEQLKHLIKEVLAHEIGLPVGQSRFYDASRQVSYPIRVVIYNNKQLLGYFDPDFYELGFHECLRHVSPTTLRNVVRHELAHYVLFIQQGAHLQPHGPEFRTFCHKHKWPEEVAQASACLEDEHISAQQEGSTVLRKVQKLMALATSANAHEAELAMVKSQQLLLKHNLDAQDIPQQEEIFSLQRVFKQKREDGKMRAIAQILETFFVSVVYHRGGAFMHLEVLGTQVNVEIAAYVASFLDTELDRLWALVQRQKRLRGVVAKNSFFLGLAKGYCTKIQALKREYQKEMTQAVLVIEKQLAYARDMAYPSLSSKHSRTRHCSTSAALGEQMGRQLNIHPAVSSGTSTTHLLSNKR